ncbi:beta family protein [Pseudoalteromonas sp. KAN5]|uniref:beta family protein n=1 Tax=Pseudoalteromonas sp. KAN5 TaxID=2916633 RepID=UPI001FCBCF97|nr:beta family protein [Pseudoalteromonas sp. KAN5]BDF95064.1 hypothetical protein KAN5_19020 [Pseudoalteromonas sp. KAN5]
MKYFIFLKSKAGDFNSIKHLNNKNTVPFFDFIANSIISDEVQKKQNSFIDKICRFWDPKSRFYIDHYDLDSRARLPNGLHPYSTYENLILKGFNLGIVTGIDRDLEHDKAVEKILSSKKDIPVVIRLNLKDLVAPRLVIQEIEELIDDLKKFTSIIDLVLDCRVIESVESKDKALNILKKFILNYENLRNDSLVIIASSSIPMTINDILKTGNSIAIQRLEYELWEDIKLLDTEYSSLTYGDYGTVSPDFQELDSNGRPIPIVPKITYTLKNVFYISRGKLTTQHPRGFKQFKDIANEVMQINGFRVNASFGDKYIELIADHSNDKSGNATTWITATMNQHINYLNEII